MRKLLLFIIILMWSTLAHAQDFSSGKADVQITGSASAGFNVYDMSGAPDRQRPFGYFVNISLSPQINNLSLPFTVIINQQQTRFTQPFNRFGISPKYKWVTLHAGHRNLNFSDFTLSGITFFGAGIELKPGKWNFGGMYGKFRDAEDEVTTLYQIPRLERKGYAGRVGYGDKKNNLNFVFMRAEDDENSINLSDSLMRNIENKANTALGVKSDVSLGKRLKWNIDAGLSLMTENLNAIGSEDLEGELPFDAKVNASSHINYAGSTNLTYKMKKMNIGAQYRYIQDGYESLGLNYLLSDLQQFTINLQRTMLKQKMNVNLSFGRMQNNLSERLASKTDRNIGSAQIMYKMSQRLTWSLSYANFSVEQKQIRDDVANNIFLIEQVNHTLNLTPIYFWSNEKASNNIATNISYQQLNDNSEVESFSENQLVTLSTNFQSTRLNSGWGYGFGVQYNSFDSYLIDQQRTGVNFSLKKSFKDNKYHVGTQAFVTFEEAGNVMSNSLTASYKPHPKHSVQLFYNILQVDNNVTFTEQRGSLSYRWSFGKKITKSKGN